jgi:hypothetical protein
MNQIKNQIKIFYLIHKSKSKIKFVQFFYIYLGKKKLVADSRTQRTEELLI